MSSSDIASPSDLELLRLIIREQQRQHERLLRVVRVWAEGGRVPAGPTPTTPRRDVQNYITAASSFGCIEAGKVPRTPVRGSESSPRMRKYPSTSANPLIICTNNVQKPLLVQTQDLRPNRSRPAPMYNSLLTRPAARVARSSGISGKDSVEPRAVRFAEVVRTRVSLYEGESEVTEDLAERFHAPFFIKLLFFILIFDLDMTLISVLAIAFALYIQGVFEPLLRFFRPENPRRVNAPQNPQRVQPADPVNNPPRQRLPQPDVNGAAENSGDSPNTSGTVADTADTPQLPNHRPWMRVVYQSLGMFLGTLLPWWIPDERYIV